MIVNFQRSIKILIAVFPIMLSLPGAAQLSGKIDSLVSAYHHAGLFEGTALVADSSGIIFHRSFGMADYKRKIPNDTSTVFRIGSLEKQFTAMLIMQLVQQNKLKLNDKITDHLPGYNKKTGSKVTIEHLLTHTSGIPNYTALPGVWDDSLQHRYAPSYILNHFCSDELEFEPGTKYKYNNTGYFILARIIEQVTGKPLSIVLKQKILIPAGMKNSGLDSNQFAKNKIASGYYRLAEEYFEEPYIYTPNAMGAASIYSTAADLYRWDRILYTNKLLRNPYRDSYLSPHFTIDSSYAYGYGWEFTTTALSADESIQTMEHSGAIRAFRAVIFRIPAEKKCVILLSNCANQSGYSLFGNILKIFRGGNPDFPKKLLADTLYKVLQNGAVADLSKTYYKLQFSDSTLYDFKTASLEFLGERLMVAQNYSAAAAVFQLSVDEDPAFTYGYFNMGRAFEKWGRVDDAITAYKKAVSVGKTSRAAVEACFQIRHLEKR